MGSAERHASRVAITARVIASKQRDCQVEAHTANGSGRTERRRTLRTAARSLSQRRIAVSVRFTGDASCSLLNYSRSRAFRATEVDAVTVQRYAFFAEKGELVGAQWCAAVGPHDAMPGDLLVGRCEDTSDDARSLGINFGVGPHRSSRNG